MELVSGVLCPGASSSQKVNDVARLSFVLCFINKTFGRRSGVGYPASS